jgi:hypothetical protein
LKRASLIALLLWATAAHAQVAVPLGPNAGQAGSGGGGSTTITGGTTATSGITSGNLIGSASNLVVDSGVAYSTLTGGPFLPLAGGTMSGLVTFPNSDIALLGSSTGKTTFSSANAGASNFTLTFPAVTDTLAVLGTAQTFTAAQLFPAGSATAPGVAVGVSNTGLEGGTASTIGVTVGGVLRFDYGISTSNTFSTASAIIAGGDISSSFNSGRFATRSFNTVWSSPANGVWQSGNVDAAAPVAQSLFFQNVVTGTSNTAGANATIQTSLPTGTGTAGLLNVLSGFSGVSGAATATFTNATPTVVTVTAHGYVPGQVVQYSNAGGALPTGISAATNYYVCKDANYAVNTYDISLSWANGACGTLVNTSSTGTGTQTSTPSTTTQNQGSLVAQFGPSALTGGQTTSGLTVNQVLNTSGSPTIFAVNVTSIAAGGSAQLFSFNVGGVAKVYSDIFGEFSAVRLSSSGGAIIVPVNGAALQFGTSLDTTLSRNAAGIFQMGTSASNALGSLLLTNLTASGIINPNSSFTPTAGSGAASVAGNDQRFVITAGTAQTAITANFGHTWGSAPVCTISSNSTASVVDITSTSTTAINLGASVALTGATINVLCFGS